MAMISHLVLILSSVIITRSFGIIENNKNDSRVMDEIISSNSSNIGQNLIVNTAQGNNSVEQVKSLSPGENTTAFDMTYIKDSVEIENMTAPFILSEKLVGQPENVTEQYEESSVVQINPDELNNTRFKIVYSELPSSWKRFCEYAGLGEYTSEFTDSVNLTVIRCYVTREYSDILSFSDLREYVKLNQALDLKYRIEITCSDWSNISLAWPMKVDNVYVLIVRHCQVLDFMSEFTEPLIQTTSDSLRVFDISDNKALIPTEDFLNFTRHVSDILPEYNCGHDETIERMSVRNFTYSFLGDIDLLRVNLMELGEQFIQDARRLPVRCIYKHLMYLDEGQSPSMSIYHTELKDSIFDELRVYNLSNSYIDVLQDNQLQWSIYFPKLEIYDLSHNLISKLYKFQPPLHNRTDQLTTINLQYNRINTITVEDLKKYKKMPTMFVDIRNNPIECNCTHQMKQLLKYIKKKKYLEISKLTNYTYIKDLQCVRPARLRLKTLQTIADLDILCENQTDKEYFLVPILILSATIVILCIMLFAILRYRQEVLIILFTRFNIIVPCHQREYDDASKMYDAFVSYSSREEEWVETLFEELETQTSDSSRRFRFCLHHRDFIPGKTIFDNVIRSVESSRHTIILLSNNFLKSEYCLYEFQEAFRQSIMEQKRHLVIVMLEELQSNKLPRDLRRCIQTFTYIKKDDYLFRERLIYALSVKQKSQTVKNGPNKDGGKLPIKKSTDTQLSKENRNKISGRNNISNNFSIKSSNGLTNNSTSEVSTHVKNDLSVEESKTNKINDSDASYNTENKTEDLSDHKGTESDKGLALNIITTRGSNNITCESPLSDHKKVLCADEFHRHLEPSCTQISSCNICVDGDPSTLKNYNRSLSRDTGYGSEKGSPDVCLHHCEHFDDVFVDADNIRDVEV